MKAVLPVLLALSLAACGGSNRATPGAFDITCAKVSNGDVCGSASASLSDFFIKSAQAQSTKVSRDQAMWVSGTVNNGTEAAIEYYYEFWLTPGCNGETTAVLSSNNAMLPKKTAFSPSASQQCDAMPEGPATMELIIYFGQPTVKCQEGDEIDPAIGQQCFKTLDGVTVNTKDRFPTGMEDRSVAVPYTVISG